MKKKFVIYTLARGFEKIKDYDLLRKRNRLLHENYNQYYNHDLVIFHEGNIIEKHQEIMMNETPNLKFIDISDKYFIKL